MTLDRSFIERNRASTNRIRALAARLSDEEMQHPVGEHWTVAITLAHLAFWDRRVMYVLASTERDGKLFIPEIDICVNDLSLPLWAAIPPRAAARIAIETAEALDIRLEGFPPAAIPVTGCFFQNSHHIIKRLKSLMKFQDKSARKKGSYFRVIGAEIRAVRSKGALLPEFQSGSSQVGPKMFNPSIL
jgi:hypothetical protein